MTVVNEILLDGTPLGALGVWYTADIADSSFVQNVKVRLNEVGPAEVRFDLESGSYTYKVTDDFARYVWADLNAGYSPGGLFREVRDESRYTPADYKAVPAAPAVQESVTISGPVDRMSILLSHATFLGLTIS